MPPETIDSQLLAVCRSCFRRLDREGAWDGIVGRPQVRERPVSLKFVHRDTRLDGIPAGAIRDLRPVGTEGRAAWIALAGDAVLAVNFARGTVRELARVPASGLDLGAPVSLHTSSDGRFAWEREPATRRG